MSSNEKTEEKLLDKNTIKTDKNSEINKFNVSDVIIKEDKSRWLQLCIFIFFSGSSTFQWVEYSIITNIIVKYYNVQSLAVDATAMSYMFFYVLFIIPGTYVAEKIGLRWTGILAAGLVSLGSWIKIFSVRPDVHGFIITFVGQSFLAVTQIFTLTIPGLLAARWFPSRQVGTATSLGIFGNQLGVALGFFLTPIIVESDSDVTKVGQYLSQLFWGLAIFSTISFILVIFFFKDEPEFPPSKTRAFQKANLTSNKLSFKEPIKRLLRNESYLKLCNSYGLGIGVLNAVGTLLNQIYLQHFANGEKDAGCIGLLIILTGMLGSVTFGVILDKTHKFKETTVIVYFLTLLGQILFAAALFMEIKWMVYLVAAFLGFFISGYLALGYEMCSEYTYPESESIASGVLNIANNIYGIILVFLCAELMTSFGDIAAHICLCCSLLIGLVLTIITKDEQRRQEAQKVQVYSDELQKKPANELGL